MKNLTPIAAVIAFLCFFAPWMSCGMITMSGYDLATGLGGGDMAAAGSSTSTPILWIVPLAALIILGMYFLFKKRNMLGKAMLPTIIVSVVALTILGMKYIDVKKTNNKSEEKTSKTESVAADSSMTAVTKGMEKMMDGMIQIKWGFWMTAVAFVTCIAGAKQLKSAPKESEIVSNTVPQNTEEPKPPEHT